MHANQHPEVDYQHVDRRTFLDNLPYGNVPYIDIQVDGRFQQYVNLAIGYLIKELQDNVDKNNARKYLYNLTVYDRNNNPRFLELLASVCEYATMLIVKGMQPDAAVRTAVIETCNINAAFAVRNFPVLAQQLSPQAKQDMGIWLDKSINISKEIEQFMNSNYPNHGGHIPAHAANYSTTIGGGHTHQHPGYGTHQPAPQFPTDNFGNPLAFYENGQPILDHQGFQLVLDSQMNLCYVGDRNGTLFLYEPPAPVNNGFNNAGAYVNYASAPAPVNYGNPGRGVNYNMNANARNVNYNAAPSAHSRFNTPAPASSSAFGTSRFEKNVREDMTMGGGRVDYRAPMQADQRVASVAPVQPTQTQQQAEIAAKFNDPKRPYDEIHTESGSIARPAHISTWKRTPNPDTPFSAAYDPTTHVLFHVKAKDGTVTENLQPMGADMDYLRNELNPTLRAKVVEDELNRSGLVASSIWSQVSRITPLEEVKAELPEPTEEEPIVLVNDAVNLGVLKGDCLDTAVVAAEKLLLAEGVQHSDYAYEYVFNDTRAYVVPTAHINKISALKDAESFLELAATMRDLKSIAGGRWWYELHDRLTARVNEMLHCNLAERPGTKIASFVDDLRELIDYINKERGAKVAEIFNSISLDIINSELGGFEILEELNDKAGVANTVFTFNLQYTVTRVPLRANELKVQINEHVGAVLESRLPGLYKAINGIFNRAASKPVNYVNHYIVTADNVRIKLYRGALSTTPFYGIAI